MLLYSVKLKLLKSLGQSPKETITYTDISTALKEIGVDSHESVLDECKKIVKLNRETLKSRFIHSEEEAVLVTTYTYGGGSNDDEENMPYRKLNKILWDDSIKDQKDKPKSYLRLLLRALRKLPRTKPQTLYRGIKVDGQEYEIGKELLWKGFSSTSTSMRATKYFLTNKETGEVDGTLFEIRGMWGYRISDFSKFPKEQGKNDTTHLKLFHFISSPFFHCRSLHFFRFNQKSSWSPC